MGRAMESIVHVFRGLASSFDEAELRSAVEDFVAAAEAVVATRDQLAATASGESDRYAAELIVAGDIYLQGMILAADGGVPPNLRGVIPEQREDLRAFLDRAHVSATRIIGRFYEDD